MTKLEFTLTFLTAVSCSLFPAGCDGGKEEKALAEAAAAKAALEQTQVALAKSEKEKDSLKSELAAVIQDRNKLQEQVSELTEGRDEPVAKATTAQIRTKKLMTPLASKKGVKKTRAPDVEFVPTPQDIVDKMLELAEVKKDDLVYDLGCGDGRIVVTAAKRYGCKAIGYDIDPKRVEESLQNVEKNEVGHLVRIEQKDIFTLDLSKANVITLYLLDELNVKLIPQLEKLKPGSRIVSHDFDMKGVRPDKVVVLASNEDEDDHTIYLWTSPLKKINHDSVLKKQNQPRQTQSFFCDCLVSKACRYACSFTTPSL